MFRPLFNELVYISIPAFREEGDMAILFPE